MLHGVFCLNENKYKNIHLINYGLSQLLIMCYMQRLYKTTNGQSRMDDSETRTALGTGHRRKTNKTKCTTQEAKKTSNTDPA